MDRRPQRTSVNAKAMILPRLGIMTEFVPSRQVGIARWIAELSVIRHEAVIRYHGSLQILRLVAVRQRKCSVKLREGILESPKKISEPRARIWKSENRLPARKHQTPSPP